jgi:hypothetical protein
VFESWYHKFAFFLWLISCGVWAYAFYEWWGIWAAIFLGIPVGIVFMFIPPMLVGTLRQVFHNDAALTWLPIIAGVALAAYAGIAIRGPLLAVLLLCGAALVWSGITLLELRLRGMEYAARAGKASADDEHFLRDIGRL